MLQFDLSLSQFFHYDLQDTNKITEATCFFRLENTLKHDEPIRFTLASEGRLYELPNYLAQPANTRAVEWLHAYIRWFYDMTG